ncbi:UDP-N-acetylmuramoyl-L-alanyl-D-glutamate--2,6-diaminopimelate ligase [Crocosphaera watsonii WH 8501]|uniref:UDP-N-acetylmuramoyl-L-alanyl-D-glutamate--2,6-diaminopimelate ligase n=6 Tax=Crocosphaera TaxID=263510 RepID=Q4C3S7_CROWT|nr:MULTISPECIES: UDP-N-acetylmuramoyl-L-alanyl-D-glutamate--2,6-diaminopimelate ligase [Crocosphaera]EAM50775.1 UDP-N-acetylmuramyl-tripeptide synthetase [Crocosphaera watsonii WH 8501]EHJ12732.1 UDP-N-acetylmuramoylalanyl-D-glutamate--2,6-diaminopimelate ligase [Crocosphaera watsonii WH 0003]MCH2243638.1 UDP-N-acetylmuramoyl-L-alanyl-D-glutamate--2,6-diaminopimelate ligase [Crocosphaera sp.]CCQ61259.1 UDP-N-acetylmuramoylalanyl-D-glutamate--2,6-diaminopimelate ligase [Crocosphaera watsonii WH 
MLTSKKLQYLLNNLSNIPSLPNHSALEREVKGISTNSHSCQLGDIFIGMPGTRVDGGEFWQSAMEVGAVAAIISPQAAQKFPPKDDDCVIIVEDIITVAAQIAAAFYDYPAQQLKMVGITGTNGKTTTTHLVEYFLNQCQKPTALIGTLYTRWPGFERTAVHTTPFAPELQEQLAEAVAANNEYCVMEVSSHALVQGRVKQCPFQVSVFTNLTQDHLDFHKDMEDYFAAKRLLFTPDYLQEKAIVNLDDPYGKRLIDSFQTEQVWTYSVEDTKADFYTSNLTYQANGVTGTLTTPFGNIEFTSPLVGQFNLSNVLAAVATVLYLGLDVREVVEKLPHFLGVPGRMERVQINDKQDISVIVDYAHTPDSLENLLKAARPFIKGKMICVFGCGGDRDRTKRPLMGQASAQLADVSVVTSDNPRTEDPQRILEDVLTGIPETIEPLVISDRAKAINTAILQANPGDGVLIAGKGHEDYQILGTEKIHFDDREEARKALEIRLKV